MHSQSIDTPQALDAAIAASRQARREKLLRAARTQRSRTSVGLALSGVAVLFALPAYFWAGDPEAATVIVVIGFISFGYTLVARRAGTKKLAEALREADQSS